MSVCHTISRQSVQTQPSSTSHPSQGKDQTMAHPVTTCSRHAPVSHIPTKVTDTLPYFFQSNSSPHMHLSPCSTSPIQPTYLTATSHPETTKPKQSRRKSTCISQPQTVSSPLRMDARPALRLGVILRLNSVLNSASCLSDLRTGPDKKVLTMYQNLNLGVQGRKTTRKPHRRIIRRGTSLPNGLACPAD